MRLANSVDFKVPRPGDAQQCQDPHREGVYDPVPSSETGTPSESGTGDRDVVPGHR
jgi:hypothetical protein